MSSPNISLRQSLRITVATLRARAAWARQGLRSLLDGMRWMIKATFVVLMCISGLRAGIYVWRASILLAPQTEAAGPIVSKVKENTSRRVDNEKVNQTQLDIYSDPLPPRALARLGTTRFRPCGELLSFTADGKGLIATGRRLDTSNENKEFNLGPFNVWDRDSGKRLCQFGDLPNLGHLVVSSNRYIVAAWQAGNSEILPGTQKDILYLWEAVTGKLLRQFKGSRRPYAISSDGQLLAADLEGKFGLWEMATGKLLWELNLKEKDELGAVAFSDDSKTLAEARWRDLKSEVRLWEVHTGRLVRTWGNELWKERRIQSIIYSSDNKKLVVQSFHGTRNRNEICLLDEITGKVRPLCEFKGLMICSMVFAPDGKSLVSLGNKILQGYKLSTWNAQSGQQRCAFPTNAKHLSSIFLNYGFSANGQVLALSLGSSPNSQLSYGLLAESHRYQTVAVTYSPPSTDKVNMYIDIWEVASGRKLQRLKVPEEPEEEGIYDVGVVTDIITSPDGKFLACSLASAELPVTTFLWDLATGKRLRHRFRGLGPVFSPDSTIIATRQPQAEWRQSEDEKSKCYLWDVTTGNKLGEIQINPSSYSLLFFSQDGRTLMATDQYAVEDRIRAEVQENPPEPTKIKTKVQMYPLYRDKRPKVHLGAPRTILNIDGVISVCTISPDGRMLAAAHPNDVKTVYMWETATGKERGRFRGHNGRIASLVFSSDGRRLASASYDTTILIWDVTGRMDLHGQLRATQLSARKMQERWTDLSASDAVRAHQAMCTLMAVGQSTVDFIATRLRPTPPVAGATLNQLIANLGCETETIHQQAQRQLEALGEIAEPNLRRTLEKQPSLKLRRSVDYLLALIEEQWTKPSGQILRMLRAIEVLEQIGISGARKLLEVLSGGAPGARQTMEAKASLTRLAQRVVQP